MKILYFDTETSGLDSKTNDILTIGGIIEIDGEVEEEFYLEMQSFNYDNISEEALKINGLELKKIKTFMSPKLAYKQLQRIFSKYINRYNKLDKFTCVGHNVRFDLDFLTEFWKKNNDKYLGSYIDYHFLDTMVILNLMMYKKAIQLENCKLVTATQKFGIKLDAHNAMNDIKATRELFKKLISKTEFK
jgi:DNA polymerase-3 subunit epsilon